MNLDDNTKWIIEKAIVIGVAVLGLLGSGKISGHKAEKPAGDWPTLAAEQRQLITDLKERLDQLEDAANRKDRFIVQLLHDSQDLQRTINGLERELNRPLTQWEIKLVDNENEAA